MKWVWTLIAVLFLSNPVLAATKAIVYLHDVTWNGTNIVADITVRPSPASGLPTLRTTVSGAAASVDATNIVASLKTLLITYALSQYGLTVVASEILIVGAPQ